MNESELSQYEDTISEYMGTVLEGLTILRSKMIKRNFPRMHEQFESRLSELMKETPSNYKESEDSQSYRTEDHIVPQPLNPLKQVQSTKGKYAITAGGAAEVINAMRSRSGMPPVRVRKK
jgi:hypothetical protein